MLDLFTLVLKLLNLRSTFPAEFNNILTILTVSQKPHLYMVEDDPIFVRNLHTHYDIFYDWLLSREN